MAEAADASAASADVEDAPSTSASSSLPLLPPDISSLLRQKEHDIEIAAQIGQTLLDRNRELQMRNEFLEESIAASNEQATQLRHELTKRAQLLSFFSIDDDEHFSDADSSTGAFCRQLERLKQENFRLSAESKILRKEVETQEADQRVAVSDIRSQLSIATSNVAKLQALVARKNEECATQAEHVAHLLAEIGRRSNREKELSEANESLIEQLDEAVARHEELAQQMLAMQDLYTEVKSMFDDAEEELRAYRQKPSPYRSPSMDSLYDSLASELENSDSGVGWTPRSARARRDAVASRQAEPISTATDMTPQVEQKPLLLSLTETVCHAIEPEEPTPCVSLFDELRSVTEAAPVEETSRKTPTPPALPTPFETVKEVQPEPPSQLSLPAPPDPSPAPSSTPRSRSSSSHSLSDYEAPSLGEPGIPGTRDLRASIRRLSLVRRQVRPSVRPPLPRPRPLSPAGDPPPPSLSSTFPARACYLERDYAAFRARKGLRPSTFFPSGGRTPEAIKEVAHLHHPFLVGETRSVLPWRAIAAVGLHGAAAIHGASGAGDGGVLRRAEIPSNMSPLRQPHAPLASSGLGSLSTGGLRLSLSSFMPSGGIVSRGRFS